MFACLNLSAISCLVLCKELKTSEGSKIPEDMKPTLPHPKLDNSSHYFYNMKKHKFKHGLYVGNSNIFRVLNPVFHLGLSLSSV
jgi:hypothetical protein